LNADGNQRVVLPAGDIVFDSPSFTFQHGLLIPAGSKLVMGPGAHDLTASSIIVFGEFRVGTEACPFMDRLTITLFSDGNNVVENGVNYGQKGIGLGAGGIIEMHGTKGLGLESWTQLGATAAKGATSITLATAPKSWAVGDAIVIASTDFNMNQAEQVVITGINGNTINIDHPLNFMHFGAFSEGVDLRAEVGLLTRNIRIQGTQDQGVLGGHFIVQVGFGAVHVEGVEFAYMGQGNFIGRYPVHFHQAGEAPAGTYVRFSSIHHSNFRCVTLHATMNVRIEGIVAYDHFGHCFFTEDGVEQRNVFERNLGLVTKNKAVSGSGGVGEVGIRSDFEAPTTYWITHPSNQLTNNVAGGSAHTGIWYLFRHEPSGMSRSNPLFWSQPPPNTVPLALSKGNRVHSSGLAGMFVEPTNHNFALDNDGRDVSEKPGFLGYGPLAADGSSAMTTFEDLTVFKTRMKGAWFRGIEVTFRNCKFADNLAGLTVASAGSHPDGNGGGLITGCTFVGWSDNKGTPEDGQPPINNVKGATTPRGPGEPVRGYQFYDGAQTIENCAFRRYEIDSYARHSAIGCFFQNMWQMAATNEVKNADFDAVSNRFEIIAADAPNYVLRLDGDSNIAVADRLGATSGYAGSWIVNNYPYFKTPKCIERPDWNAVVCPHKFANVWIENQASNTCNSPTINNLFLPGMFTVRDQQAPGTDWNTNTQEVLGIAQFDQWGNKFRYQVVASTEASYSIHWPHQAPASVYFQLNNVNQGDSIRYSLCYPTSASNFVVRRSLFIDKWHYLDKNAATILPATDSLNSPAFRSGDAYYWDSARGLLFITLYQRYERSDYYNYCPDQGCEVVWVDANVPAGTSGDCRASAYPYYSQNSGAFFDKALTPASTVSVTRARATVSSACGDGICTTNSVPAETCLTCPQDCGQCAVCGDGVCDASAAESISCPQDCGFTVSP
jgi:hypothetical protein